MSTPGVAHRPGAGGPATSALAIATRFATVGRQATRVAERNVTTLTTGSWIVLATGFFEPFFYLLSIGVGLGNVVGPIGLADGRVVDYATFVAPAMVATYAMSSALTETTFVFVGRLRYLRVYDAILNTPVRPLEIALGELGWAAVRVSIYAAGFLAVMTVFGYTSVPQALVALPATVLAAVAFGCMGILAATMVRDWRDFDAMSLVQFALFMFSATFSPLDAYPRVVRWVIEVTPLYHAVALVRAICTGTAGWAQLVNIGYLAAATALGLAWTARRVARLLIV